MSEEQKNKEEPAAFASDLAFARSSNLQLGKSRSLPSGLSMENSRVNKFRKLGFIDYDDGGLTVHLGHVLRIHQGRFRFNPKCKIIAETYGLKKGQSRIVSRRLLPRGFVGKSFHHPRSGY